MLAVAAIGVTAVVALGSTALLDTQDSVNLQRTEHAMTLLDSRGAMAALGESESQQVALSGNGDGTYEVDPDSGWINVTHINHTSTENETILNRSLGSVRYTAGDTVVAYEGGGVWRTQDNGTVMVSPPEFHYRDQTLTMPLVRVAGSGGASGRITAEVSPTSSASDVTRIFPNDTTTGMGPGAPYDVGGGTYDNPVENGTVTVTVHSEHYQGWATYFEERTDGNLTVDHDAKTATIELVTLKGAPGDFDMPPVGSSVEAPSVAQQHNVTTFELTLAPEDENNNQFQQLHWSLYEQGPNGQQFELHFASNGRCQSGSFNSDIAVSLYYRHNNSAPNEEWQTTVDPEDGTQGLLDVDCTDSVPMLDVNLTSTTELTYQDIDVSGNKWHFSGQIEGTDVPEELRFDQHAVDPTDEFEEGDDSEEIGFLIDHYFSRMGPDFDLTVEGGPGNSNNRIDESASFGTLVYDTVDGKEFIQFLHVTENEVRVELKT
jgi:hypothetical protein